MRAQAPATIKCLLKGLREAGTSAPSFPPRKTLPVGRSRSCKGKQRQESWVVTSWAKGQQAGTKEVVSAQAQKSMHTGIEPASATSVEQEEKKHQQPPQRLLRMWLLPSCLPAGSISIPHRPLSQGSPSPSCLPCSPHGKLTAPLESLSPGTQGQKMSFLHGSHSVLGQPACYSLAP